MVLVNDDEIGEYAYEPVRSLAEAVESGDDWKAVIRKRMVARRPGGEKPEMARKRALRKYVSYKSTPWIGPTMAHWTEL